MPWQKLCGEKYSQSQSKIADFASKFSFSLLEKSVILRCITKTEDLALALKLPMAICVLLVVVFYYFTDKVENFTLFEENK